MRRTNPKAWLATRRGTPRPPVEETIRWQVSRLAEQDFSSDPRLPDPLGSVAIGDLSGHGRGGGCFLNSNL
jgi:hypothetical protein